MNNEKISSKPDIFYSELYNVFSKFRKAELSPYPQITENRMGEFYTKIVSNYNQHHIKLVFERKDFTPTPEEPTLEQPKI